MVAHTFNPRTWEAEAGRFQSSRPGCSTKWVLGEPGLHREALSLKNKQTNKKNFFPFFTMLLIISFRAVSFVSQAWFCYSVENGFDHAILPLLPSAGKIDSLATSSRQALGWSMKRKTIPVNVCPPISGFYWDLEMKLDLCKNWFLWLTLKLLQA